MKKVVKTVGLVQAKNEWPLLALSISYALMYHVDEVYVLNHSSSDGTFEGLNHLKELWKDRLHVLSCHDEHSWQEAQTNTLIAVAQSSSPDWIYVFDADEFLLVEGSIPLKVVLGEVDPKYTVVRYDVQHWISTENFDDKRLDDYRMLRYRSVPNDSLRMTEECYASEIWKGSLNYFDVPFPPKVIFRNTGLPWLAAGAHLLKNPVRNHFIHMDATKFRAAHLSLLTKGRVEHKAMYGRGLIKDRFSPAFGWQLQMIYLFAQENKLDEFWGSHSISTRGGTNNRKLPIYVIDDSFVHSIEHMLNFIGNKWDSLILQNTTTQDPAGPQSDDTHIPFRTAVQVARNFQLIADSMLSRYRTLLAERNALAKERDALLKSDPER